MTKGAITYQGDDITALDPAALVRRGVIQVMEGRHCFEHLTVEENLLTGAYTRRDGSAAIKRDLEMVYDYFPRLRERRKSQAGYTSGGEQQMTAMGRALMSRPQMILLDRPSMGLAPQLVEQIFQIVKAVNEGEGVTFLLAEQNTSVALRYAHQGYILENGRVMMEGPAAQLRENPDVKEFYLGMSDEGASPSARCAAIAGASAGWPEGVIMGYYDDLETRDEGQRAEALAQALPLALSRAKLALAMARLLRDVEPEAMTDRAALARLPVIRKAELSEAQRKQPPFGGYTTRPAAQFDHIFKAPARSMNPVGAMATGGGLAASCMLPAWGAVTSCRTVSAIT